MKKVTIDSVRENSEIKQYIVVLTQSGCAWKAVSNAPWITIVQWPSGKGTGATQYQVAPNSGPARVGTITMAGKTFTVTQAAGQ